MKKMFLSLLAFSSTLSFAAPRFAVSVLSDPALLRMAGLPIWREDTEVQVAYTVLNDAQMERLSQAAHSIHRCAGYEVLNEINPSQGDSIERIFQDLRDRKNRDEELAFLQTTAGDLPEVRDERIALAMSQVTAEGVKKWVEWFASFHDRFNRGNRANDAITQLKTSLEGLIANAAFPVTVDLIAHESTPQKSLRLMIQGAVQPKEVIVLGAHADSVNWQDTSSKAPGADDNASGSSNLIETLRILLAQGQPDRSIHFFWYAGEESGLLGSAEIAKTYKQQNVDVVAALQLDMTMVPGSGANVISSIRDFTSPWLHDYLMKINQFYLNLTIESDKCGYACSDHASWHRRGYHALFPFESGPDQMNNKIHTAADIIDSRANFDHAAQFSRIAVAFAMHLANSTHRGP
jgi:bacterial leucyl aminopeptidase